MTDIIAVELFPLNGSKQKIRNNYARNHWYD